MNGSIGLVIKNIYRNKNGPRDPVALPHYTILGFQHWKLTDDKTCFLYLPKLCVPVPTDIFKCDNYCISADNIPLRVYKATSIRKYQGISVGTGTD